MLAVALVAAIPAIYRNYILDKGLVSSGRIGTWDGLKGTHDYMRLEVSL